MSKTHSPCPASYQTAHFDPLIGLPSELIDPRLHQVKAQPSAFCEARPHLFNMVSRGNQMDGRTLWKHIFPYRHIVTCCPLPTHSSEEVYESMVSSLQSWFSVEPLTPVGFSLWSIATMVSIMRNLGQDFETRSVLFHLASQDIREVFECGTKEQVQLLSQRLNSAH